MDRLLARAQFVLLFLSVIYLAFLTLLTLSYFQRHAIYLHAVRWPLFADLTDPVRYGLSPSRSLNVQLKTRDGLRLGAWFILPPSDSSSYDNLSSTETISTSLSTHPTVLLFHGNAASRAVPFRIQHCTTYAARFGANVLAIDYRGFADSEGSPSESGLVADARAAWDWSIERGAKAENVLLVGASLGTGVASALGAELAEEGIEPRGIVLLAPFTSIKALLYDYHLFGFIPILQPLQPFPPLQSFFTRFLQSQFNTTSILPKIKAPIFLAHSQNDYEIPAAHSMSLFEQIINPYLPAVPAPADNLSPAELKSYEWTAYRAAYEKRRARRASLVQTQEIPGFGSVQRLERAGDFRNVTYVETLWGGHDGIGLQEGVVDLIRSVFFTERYFSCMHGVV
ncbi:alpha/beta-hydrolase [Phellopilus nigrolimitatus]|nr:alpha/beta-hydrolase [Phellopilus nigrolimitatus]